MIIFRADGNQTLGAGHVMRCLSIADALKSLGKDSLFVCADFCVEKLIKERGYEVCVLETDYTSLEDELDILFAQNVFKRAEGMVVDSYYVTDRYLKELSQYKKVVYVDDYLSDFDVNGLINYNVYADKKAYEEKYDIKKTRLILGPSYAPLRNEFVNTVPIFVKEKPENVLILTGGADPFHIALKMVKEISGGKDSSLTYHFVVGAFSPDFEEIKTYENNKSIVIHHNVTDMKSLMCECDMAVSASGSTLYELCACGIPTINYTFADNQLMGAKAFSDLGIMKTAGDVRENDNISKEILTAIDSLAAHPEERRKMSEAAHRLVDGCGAERLAKELEELFK